MTRSRIAAILLVALASLPIASPVYAWKEGDEDKCPARSVYRNGYGFELTIPPGLKGCPNSPVDFSDHGVWIPLDRRQHRAIEAYAGYNGPVYETAREAASATVDRYREDKDYDSVSVVSRSRATLGGLPAVRVVIRYRVKRDGRTNIHDSTEALRSLPRSAGAPAYQYSVSLTTTAGQYEADRVTLDQVLASWKQTATAEQDSEPPAPPAGGEARQRASP